MAANLLFIVFSTLSVSNRNKILIYIENKSILSTLIFLFMDENYQFNINKKLTPDFLKWVNKSFYLIFEKPLFWFFYSLLFVFLFSFLQSSFSFFILGSSFFFLTIQLLHKQYTKNSFNFNKLILLKYFFIIIFTSFLSSLTLFFINTITQPFQHLFTAQFTLNDYINPFIFFKQLYSSTDLDFLFFNLFNIPFYYILLAQISTFLFTLPMLFPLFIWFNKSLYFSILYNKVIFKNNFVIVIQFLLLFFIIDFIIFQINYLVFPFFYIFSIAVIYNMWIDFFNITAKNKEIAELLKIKKILDKENNKNIIISNNKHN